MVTIDGKYEVLRPLGEGFGGRVFLVEAKGQKSALKQLQIQEGALTREQILEGFKSEFSTLKELSHPHIVRILDFGYDTKKKIYYFTSEFIDGPNIYEATRNLKPQEIEELFVQALRALSYLHSQKIYHFDIKPSNILVAKDAAGKAAVKLIDFGLAKLQSFGVLVGSPAYLPPEIHLEERRDGRADLYALGVTWYECLTGTNPFRADDMQESLDLHRIWMPPPASSQSARIPAYLDPILDKLLKKNPVERYHRADQVIRDLNFGGGHHYPLETEATALSYIPTEGQLTGRESEWASLLTAFERVFKSRDVSCLCVLISGAAGTGKSRLVKELRYYAQLQGVPVATVSGPPFPDVRGDTLLLMDDVSPDVLKTACGWLHQLRGRSVFVVATGTALRECPEADLTLSLGNLDREAVSRFASQVLGVEDPPDALVDQLFARSDGNPLLLTDLLHSVIQSQQIFDEGGRWSPARLKEIGINFENLRVPRNLQEYCRAKYDSLSPIGCKILIAVSIAKAPLDRRLLDSMSPETTRLDWSILEEEDLISVSPATGAVRLLNPIFQEWIPPSVDLHTLASVHQALGELLRANRETEEAAWYHLGCGLGETAERYRYLMQYGDALLDETRWTEALKPFEMAAGLAPAMEDRIAAYLQKGRALFFAGDHGEALKVLERTQGILSEAKDRPDQWRWVQRTYRDMCNIYLRAGRLDLARECLQVSRVLLEDHGGEPAELMILENFRASLLMREGKLKEAAAISEGTQRQWEDMDFETKKQVLNNELGAIYLAQGEAERAKLLFQAQASFYQAIGNMTKRAYAIYGWAESCCSLKQFDEATQIYDHCIDLSRSLKNEELLINAYTGLGNIAYCLKAWDRCVENYQNALELAQKRFDVDYAVVIAVNLAIVMRHRKEFGEARLYLRHAIDTIESRTAPSVRQLQWLFQAYGELGKLHQENGEWVEARDAYRDALKIIRFHESLRPLKIEASVALAHAAEKLGRLSEVQSIVSDLERSDWSPEDQKRIEAIKGLLSGDSTAKPMEILRDEHLDCRTTVISLHKTF